MSAKSDISASKAWSYHERCSCRWLVSPPLLRSAGVPCALVDPIASVRGATSGCDVLSQGAFFVPNAM